MSTTQIFKSNNLEECSFVFYGSGFQNRMKKYGHVSNMLYEDNKKIIQYQVDTIRKNHPKAEIVYCVGFEAEDVMKSSNVHFVENLMYEITNSAEDLRIALNAITKDRAILIQTNMLFDNSIDIKDNTILYANNKNMDEEGLGVSIYNGKALKISYGLENNWANITHVNKDCIDFLRSRLSTRSYNKKYAFEVINEALDKFDFKVKECGPDIKRVIPKNEGNDSE